MSDRISISRIRNMLIIKATEMGHVGATSASVVDAVINEQPDIAKDYGDHVLRVWLTKLLNEARSKAPVSVDSQQHTLFGLFGVSRQIRVRSQKGKLVWKNLDICTFDEVEESISLLPSSFHRSRKRENLEQLINTLSPFRSSGTTLVGETWAAFSSRDDAIRA